MRGTLEDRSLDRSPIVLAMAVGFRLILFCGFEPITPEVPLVSTGRPEQRLKGVLNCLLPNRLNRIYSVDLIDGQKQDGPGRNDL